MGRRLVSIIENLAIQKPETNRHQQEEAVDPKFRGHPCLWTKNVAYPRRL